MFIGVSTAISAIRRVSKSFIRDGLKLYYRFTETFNESQPELLLSGATSFDGSDDYINTGTAFSNTNHTISAWVNASATGGVVFDNRDANDDGIRFLYDSNLTYQLNSSDITVSNPSLNTWHHIACTYDGTTQKLYLNGSLVASASTSQTVSVSQNLLFGKQSYSDVAYFNGSIANVGIWNRALSLSEIESIYWKGQYADLKGTELTNLVSWYNLSADANDSTGTNNGTNNGATFLTDAYSASSPFLPRIQDKATPKGAVALASGSTSFDGSDDYISFPFQESGNYTISAWFKLDVAQTSIVVNWGDQATGERRSLLIWNGGSGGYKVYSSTYGSNIAGSTVLSAGVWYHASVTVDVSDGSAKIYLNGSLDGSGTNTINSFTGTTGEIGRQPGGEYFEGSIANVAIYSDVKTQSEIQDIMFSSYSTLTSALKTNLVSWYDLGSTELGNDLVTNGDFATDSNWTKNTGWSIANGLASCDGSQSGASFLFQDIGIEVGRKYKITFDLSNYSAGSVRVRTGSSATGEGVSGYYNANSSIEVELFGSGSGANFFFEATTSFTGSIDNVVVKEIQAPDAQGDNEGSIYGATTNTGYTNSPSGVADPLNYGEVYGGNAVSFDGTNDYVNIVNSVEWQKPKTISMWFKATSISSHGSNVYNKDTLIGYANLYWAIQLDVNKKIQYFYYDGSLRSWLTDSTITLGKWHHIAVVSDGDSSQIFLDGQSIGSNSLTWDDVTIGVDKQLKLGGTGGGFATQPFTGSMSHVQVFSEALTQDQVRELYTKPELTLPTGIASSALKLDMPMQEGSGVAILDGSGNQNHGTGSGITWATGQEYGFQHPLVRSNNPMVFDGSNDYVLNNTDATWVGNTYTFSYWIKTSTASSTILELKHNSSGVMLNNQFFTSLTSDGKIRSYQGNSSGATVYDHTSTNAVHNGAWHHIALSYDNSTFKIYIDGSLDSTDSGSGTISQVARRLYIGINRNDGDSVFNSAFTGMMNDVAIWSSALTANEITALYNSGLPLLTTTDSGNYASSSDLVGYWRNDGVTTWTDRSTNSNNGTVDGDPASIIVPEGLNEGRDSQGYYLTDTDSISSGIRFKGAEYISVQDSESLDLGTSDFTLECWLKTTSQGYLRIMDKRDASSGFTLSVNTSEKINLELNDGSGNSGFSGNTAVNDGNWHHVIVSADRSANAKFYLDGALDDTDDISAKNGSLNSVSTLFIGADAPNGDSLFFNGSIDEVRIYKGKALSATEVLKNYNNGKSAHSN